MFKKIIEGYTALFLAVLRFAALMAVCAGSAILIVWPLWLLADTNPPLYTLVFSVLFGSAAALIAGMKIRAAFRRDSRLFLRSLVRKLTLIAGFSACVALVLAYRRDLAAAALVVTLAVYGFLAFVPARDSRHTEK